VTTVVVLDASVAVKWVLAEDGSEAAVALRGQHTFIAPELLLVETANILWRKARQQELTPDEARVAHAVLLAADIAIRPMRSLMATAMRFALALEHPVYDCAYLGLAAAEGVPLVTADRRLARVVRMMRSSLDLPDVIIIGDSGL
jgi:predicted nucleic acid-binding protein